MSDFDELLPGDVGDLVEAFRSKLEITDTAAALRLLISAGLEIVGERNRSSVSNEVCRSCTCRAIRDRLNFKERRRAASADA